jgi:hypothetical protein
MLRPDLSMMVVVAQDDPLAALRDEYAKLESEGLKENFHRQLSYHMLQPYLPPGARLTSGYRSPQKQLDLILRLARAHNIPTQSPTDLNDEKTWRPALMALRQKGFIIAAPTTTPHGTDEAVFDLSGADLGVIQAGLRRAEKEGMVKFTRIILESQNNAVHVEIESISPKALNALGQRRPASPGVSPGTGATQSSEDEQRRGMLQQLQDLHDGEPDPAKKIDYDRSRRNLYDPVVDSATIEGLDDEIEQHQRELERLESGGERKEAVVKVSEALREGRYEDAERGADEFAKAFPDDRSAQDMLSRVRTHRLVSEARDALEESGCRECERADRLINDALLLSPGHQGAKWIREEVDACLKACETRHTPFIILGLIAFLIFAASSIGYYLLSRQGVWPSKASEARWVLEGIEGPCEGQVFPLDKPEVAIGSSSTADIVISDAQRKISRQHCCIIQNGKQFYLLDESTNGTTINDQEIEKGVPTEFRHGDSINLADVAILLLRRDS